MASLWPDADGAAAKTSFDTTLFRLRKLLDIDRCTRARRSGKLVAFRARIAWTDVWALETALDAADAADERTRAPRRRRPRGARRLLDAYPGPLLGCRGKPRGSCKPREVVRARFVRTLTRLGEALEASSGLDEQPPTLYRRGLEVGQPRRSRSIAASCAALVGDRRAGRGAQCLPAVPRAPFHRARCCARRRNGAAPPGNRRCAQQNESAVSPP